MELLRKERLRARLLHMPFDYPVCPYRMSLADYFVRAPKAQMHSERITSGLSVSQETEFQRLVCQLQLSDRAPDTSTSILVTPSFLDSTSLLTLYFPEENDEYGTFVEIANTIDGAISRDEYYDEMFMVDMSQITDDVQPMTTFPLDLFKVLAIEIVEDVQFVPTPGLLTVVAPDDDVFVGVSSLVVVESEHVDPPLSFDVLSGFISRFDDVLTLSSYMDMSLFEYFPVSYDITLSTPQSPTSQIFDIDDEIVQRDSNEDSSFASYSSPSDQRVSPTIGDTKIVDFGTADQPKELRIGLDLSTDERDNLIQLLRSYLNVFALSYEDMSGFDPSIVQHLLPLLPHVRLVKQKLRRLHPR